MDKFALLGIHIEDISNVGQGRERSFLVYQSNLLDEISSPVRREVANRCFKLMPMASPFLTTLPFSKKVVKRIDDDVENGKLEIKEKSICHNMSVNVHNKALLLGIAYCISSCSMILVNNYVLSSYNFNAGISLMLYQNFVSVVVVSILSFFGVISTKPLTLRLIKVWSPVNVRFVGMLITTMFSLKYLNVAMVTVLKNVTKVITAVGEMYIFNRHHDSQVWTALFLMIVSAVSGGIADLSFHATGYTWHIINCFLTASCSLTLHRIMDTTKQVTKSGNLDEFSMVLLNNTLSLPLRLLLLLFNEVNYLSTTLVGSLNKIHLSVAGIFLFNVPISLDNTASIFFGEISILKQ